MSTMFATAAGSPDLPANVARARADARFERLIARVVLVSFAYLLVGDGFLRLKTGVYNLNAARDLATAVGMLAVFGRFCVGHQPVRFIRGAGLTVLFLAIVAVNYFNPAATSLPRAVLASRQEIEFVPFFLFGAMAFNSAHRLRQLAMVFVICGAVNGAVGVAQSSLTPDQLAAWGPGYAQLLGQNDTSDGLSGNARTFSNASGKNQVRPPALGSDAGFAGVVALLAVPFGIALLLDPRASKRQRFVTMGCLPVIAAGLVTCQTRALVVAVGVGLLGVGVLTAGRRGGFKVLLSMLLAVSLAVAGGTFYSGRGIDLSRLTHLGSGGVGQAQSARGGSLPLVPKYAAEYPFGAGLGSVGPATRVHASANAFKLSGENTYVYLLVEVGIAGLLCQAAIYALTLVGSIRLTRSLGQADQRPYLLAIAAVFVSFAPLSLAGGVTAAPPLSTAFWLFAGVVPAALARAAARRRA